MVFDLLLYGSLSVFIFGFVWKSFRWFSRQIPGPVLPYTIGQRIYQAGKGLLCVVFSGQVLTLLKALVLDVFLQRRILKENTLRWVMHMLIFAGFMLLLLMHALEAWTSSTLFQDYVSTANPYLFLRNLFGLMVLAGVGIALYRRFVLKVPRLRTSGMDLYAIIIVAVIIFSGFSLEGAKIISHNDYQRMVEEYADADDPDELKALEAYWVQEFGVVSPNLARPFEAELLNQGKELHEVSCQGCHTSPGWAFIGYTLSMGIRPMARLFGDIGATDILWTIHILASFFGLAYLPFSKMFHIITSPLSLLASSVMDGERSHPANILTRQMMELDACTRCGTCSLRCSSVSAFEAMDNDYILPSERLQFLKRLAAGKTPAESEMQAVREGVYICTNCDRCTVVCPSGINLRELWLNVREGLVQLVTEGEPLMLSTYSFVRGLNRPYLTAENYFEPLEAARRLVAGAWRGASDQEGSPLALNGNHQADVALSYEAGTFFACFGCQNCTTVCPVVTNYDNPQETLGLLPHQIMCSLGLGLFDMACGSRMLWDCVTCYQCQEHCPQMVEVTDILYQLKNMAIKGPQDVTKAARVTPIQEREEAL